MPEVIEFEIPTGYPGTQRSVLVYSFGRKGARPKAYIQAALHAEELNGTLAIDLLCDMLAEIERQGSLTGEICLVPLANPIGLTQHIGGRHLGRFQLESNENFNRHFPNLAAALTESTPSLKGLQMDLRLMVSARLKAALERLQPSEELPRLRRQLMQLSIDAEIILDLHVADRGNFHIYISSPKWPAAQDLPAFLAAESIILNEVDPTSLSFSEANAHPWLEALKLGIIKEDALPTVATVELRGRGDVDAKLVERDARALLGFLRHRGLIQGGPVSVPRLRCEPSPLSAMDVGYAPTEGIILPHRNVGDRVSKGEKIATIIDPHRRHKVDIVAGGSGVIFALRGGGSFVRSGSYVFRIAGSTALEHRIGKKSVDD